MSSREQDLGRLAQRVGRRLEDEGQGCSQRFHDWKRTEQIETDSTRGGRGVPRPEVDRAGDRAAARLAGRWLHIRLQLEQALAEADRLMDEARPAVARIEPTDRTTAEVEADGWCGSHFRRIGELVPVSLRPSGEPWYRGRCRFCGSWPGGDPPVEVLRTRSAGKAVRVAAS